MVWLLRPSNNDKTLSAFNRIQLLRGGEKYPQEFDIVPNSKLDKLTAVSDPQIVRMFLESIIPQSMVPRTSMSNVNNARDYTMSPDPTKDTYTRLADGGALFGLGCNTRSITAGKIFQPSSGELV